MLPSQLQSRVNVAMLHFTVADQKRIFLRSTNNGLNWADEQYIEVLISELEVQKVAASYLKHMRHSKLVRVGIFRHGNNNGV